MKVNTEDMSIGINDSTSITPLHLLFLLKQVSPLKSQYYTQLTESKTKPSMNAPTNPLSTTLSQSQTKTLAVEKRNTLFLSHIPAMPTKTVPRRLPVFIFALAFYTWSPPLRHPFTASQCLPAHHDAAIVLRAEVARVLEAEILSEWEAKNSCTIAVLFSN